MELSHEGPEPLVSQVTAARLTSCGKILALAWVIFLVGGHAVVWRQGSDLMNFWAAGHFVIERRAAAAYDPVALTSWQHAQGFAGSWPFISPPPFLVAAAPLGLLSYPVALALWVAFGGVVFGLSLRWLPKPVYWLAVAFPGALLAGMAGQSSLLLTALMCASVGALPRRPILAGVFIGLMVLKPQLALLAPVAFVAAGAWRAFWAAAATVTAALCLSMLLLGWAPTAAFLGSSSLLSGLFGRPELLPKIKSVFATFLTWGASPTIAVAGQVVAAAFAAWAVWRVWRRTEDSLARGAILAAATPLTPPYLLLYDVVFLTLPIAWLVVEGLRRGFRPAERALLALAYFFPIGALMGPLNWPIVPLWSLGLTLAVLQRQGANPATAA